MFYISIYVGSNILSSHRLCPCQVIDEFCGMVGRWVTNNGKCIEICDPLRENPALPANIEFQLETIFQLNSDYCTKVLQGACTVSY